MNHPEQSASPSRHAEALAILAALVLMAYANSFSGGFVVDGRPLILESARVHSVTGHHLKEILFHGYTWPAFDSGLYRPFTTLSYLVNYAILGDADQPVGYHWTNCLLHAANAFLAYLLALRLVRQYQPALFAAALWAMHPICTEAVTNIAGRPEELATFGVLGALLLYVYAGEESGRRRLLRRIAIVAAATVAVFSKESGVMVLPLAVLYDFAYRTRLGCTSRERLRELAAGFRQFFWKDYVCLALPVLVMLCVRWLVLRQDGAMEIPFVDNPISGAGFLVGRATAVGAIARYLWLLVWPRTLSSDYSFNQIPLFQWHSMSWVQWSSVAAVAGLLLLAAFCYRRGRTGFFLLGLSALTLLPAANLAVIAGTIMAERLLYLPAVGFGAAVAIGVHRLAHRLGWHPMAAAAALGAIVVAYGARTYERNPDWLNNETVFASAAQTAPDSVKPHLSLADTWFAQDPTFLQGDRAITEAETAAAIVSGLPDNQTPAVVLAVLSRIYCARGDLVAAKDADGNPHADAASAVWYHKALEAALRGVPVNRAFDENRRRLEVARGWPADEIPPVGVPEIDANLGRVYLRLDDPQKAMEAFLDLRRLLPAAPLTYSLIASAYEARNQPEEAATALLESYVLDESPSTLSRVALLYDKVDGGNCATVGRGEDRSLNRDCAIIRRDLCSAYRSLEQASREARQRAAAERFLDAGRRVPGCR